MKKNIVKLLLYSTAILITPNIINAQDNNTNNQTLKLFQSSSDGTYSKSQRVIVKAFSINKSCKSLNINITYNSSKRPKKYKLKYHGDTLIIFDKVIKKPTSIIFSGNDDNHTVSIGSIVDKEEFKPTLKTPKDFFSFWQDKKEKLNKLPLQVQETTMQEIRPGYSLSDLKINCLGSQPVRGYLAKPNNAKPKSLPIVIFCHAAGVAGSWCKCNPNIALDYAQKGKGAICFDINAHGMLNNQPDEYYNNLENNELKDYSHINIQDRDTYYFGDMYLRLLRAINYLTLKKEWDGKRILVIGESQGGGQALVAAGLDPRVSAVVATVPALCDFGESCKGGSGCWPFNYLNKKEKKYLNTTLSYFDAANIIKGSKATFVVEIGLIDTTCPSMAVHSALNGVLGKKIIYDVPYRAHHLEQLQYQDEYNKNIYEKKMKFINDYLK